MRLALICSLLAQPVFGTTDSPFLLKVGDAAPPFAMRDLDRKVFSLRHHTGPNAETPRKAIVLTFFATWCKPCMAEIPVLKRVHRRWAGQNRNVEIIYVGLSQGTKELTPFSKRHHLPWRVVPDSFGLLARRYGASQLPHLFIIDQNGKIAFQHRGIAPNLQKVLEQQLTRLTGLSAPEETAEPADIDQPRFDKTFALGRPPSGQGSTARWQPLGVFIGEQVSAIIDVSSKPSYEAFERALQEGKYQLTNAGPLLAYKIQQQYEPVARLERQGSPTYFGIIFTTRQSKILSLANLKGKTLGLVSPRSSSGGLYPQLALLDAGLVPGRDLTIKWLGSHAKVAAAVKSGQVDAGGCFEDCRDSAWPDGRAKAAGTRILSYTAEIPGEMILVKKDLEPQLKKRLAAAVLAVNDHPGILAQISQGETTVTAVLPASPADLKVIHDAVERVNNKKTR